MKQFLENTSSTVATVLLFAALVLLLFSSCKKMDGMEATYNPPQTQVTPESSRRVIIVSSSQFTDARGYDRNILILRDTQTNKEYLVVSGSGVEEIYSQYDPATKRQQEHED